LAITSHPQRARFPLTHPVESLRRPERRGSRSVKAARRQGSGSGGGSARWAPTSSSSRVSSSSSGL